jgi:hypothetical protein
VGVTIFKEIEMSDKVILREYYELCAGGVCHDLLTESEKQEVSNGTCYLTGVSALGELDHPDDSVVNLKNASHMVTGIWWDGKDVMGKCKVLNTPSGQILKSLVESGVKLGISSRGLGSVHEENGNTIVENDFQLICFDFVSEPSTTGAYMNLSESKQKQLFTKADRLNRLLNDIVR